MPAQKPIAGRYEVLETLFADERGEELRARDLTLGREVLLVRRPCAVQLDGRVAVERALREARALAGLRHAAIQKLHDVLEDESGPTLVLEPVAGETLEAVLAREQKLEPEEVRRLGIELADALASVHAAGAVHRDVGERTIVVRGDGSPCLTGFRLAKPATLSGATSIQYGQVESVAGCKERVVLPLHPAPEQLAGEPASARTDLFALACVLYRALTGREAMPAHLTGGWRQATDPARLVPGTPPVLAKQIMASLARSPIGRPQSAIELRDALRAEKPASARTTGPESRSRGAGVGLGLAALVALALLGWRFWPRAEAPSGERGLAANTANAATAQSAFASGFRESHALLIGIGEVYKRNGFPPLANAVRDVEALDEALRSSSADRWQTRLLREEECSFDGIRAALAELEAKLEPEDRALVYFAGHGEPHERSDSSGWLIPADAETAARDPARLHWLPFDAFARFLTDASAKHVLLAMDCCYGGRLAATRAAGASAYKARFTTEPASVVLASGRANEKVSDGSIGQHSPFAETFLEALKPGAGAFTSGMLYSAMLKRFTDLDLPQTPVIDHPKPGAGGEFVFLLGD